MTVKNLLVSTALIIVITIILDACTISARNNRDDNLALTLRSKAAVSGDTSKFVMKEKRARWVAAKTAIIVTDMWNQHWCKGATERVAELAPFMNEVISAARRKGVLIVYAPSDCMDYYKDYPGRKQVAKYYDSTLEEPNGMTKLHTEENRPWPVDQSNEGCNDTPRCEQKGAWTKQIEALQITDKDIISDSGSEIESLFKVKGIDNVMIMGVHTNMCIIHRSFGLRNMIRYRKNVVLVRDLTDAMYDSRQFPYVNHYAGVGLIVDYIEKYIAPTVLSTDITGTDPFHFSADPARLTYR